MINCYLTPRGVQSHCREEKLWLNRIVLEYDNSLYIAKLMLYTSYRSKKAKKVMVKSYTNNEDLKTFVLELWSLYPRLEIDNDCIMH